MSLLLPTYSDNGESQARTALCKKIVSLSFNDKEKENEGLKKQFFFFLLQPHCATWFLDQW